MFSAEIQWYITIITIVGKAHPSGVLLMYLKSSDESEWLCETGSGFFSTNHTLHPRTSTCPMVQLVADENMYTAMYFLPLPPSAVN